MKLNLFAIFLMIGVAVCHLYYQNISRQSVYLLFFGLLIFWLLVWLKKRLRLAAICATAMAAGLLWTHLAVSDRLQDVLSRRNDDQTAQLTIQVTEMATYGPDYVRFRARVLSSRPQQGIPKSIVVNWSDGMEPDVYKKPAPKPVPHIMPGQIWQMYAKLRRPFGLVNPHLSTKEAYYMASDIRATATVKGQPKLLNAESSFSLGLRIERIRDRLRESLYRFVDGRRWGGVILALVIGDQQSIEQDDWQLFNQAGITHLMSISGSHITLFAGLASSLCFLFIKIIGFSGRGAPNSRNAFLVSGLAGVIAAGAYSLIAGWGVPAQRTFYMLLIFFGSYALRVNLSPITVLLVAGAVIALCDPWSVMSPGFFLSFGAMMFLIFLGRAILQKQSLSARLKAGLRVWVKAQLVIFIGLAPTLIGLYHQVSLISPLINAYAIFIIGTLVTPAALLMAVLALFPYLDFLTGLLSEAINFLLETTLEITEFLVQFRFSLLDVGASPLFILALASAAFGIWLMPRFSRFHFLWCLPALLVWFAQAPRIPQGEWRIIALNVGNAVSVIVQTRDHVLLFDTGVRLSYSNVSSNTVILPVLRAMGIRKIDRVIVSHSDIDHAGGFSELVSQMPVGQAYASFRLDHWIAMEESKLHTQYKPLNPDMQAQFCTAGTRFEMDGIAFEFLWPQAPKAKIPDKAPNSQSCVLSIKGRYHKALLTGDLEKGQEQWLLQHKQIEHYDVAMVPHHGSKTSSSPPFVSRLNPQIAFAQTGKYNRFGHPVPQIVERWQRTGARFYDTGTDGAVTIRSSREGLESISEKENLPYYWLHES